MSRPRIVIVGAGFAGYQCARTLARESNGAADIVLVNPNDYFLYLPLLPEVAAGVLEPRRITVSLTGTLPGVRLVLGEAEGVDLADRRVEYVDPEGRRGSLSYDRLVLTVGSVNKLLPVPGVTAHAHGFRGMPEALYHRDHVTRQMELAGTARGEAERLARTTFVVVGAGYTGTEVAAHGVLFTDSLARRDPALRDDRRPRWLLVDIAGRVLPELDPHLSHNAHRVLRKRGVEVRTGTSVKEATADGVLLDDGEFIACRTLIWCVGVRPDPLVEAVGLPTDGGRLTVDERLAVPGHPEVLACGDAAAVPDSARPGRPTPMTAQHARRQGRLAAHNLAASLGRGTTRPYGTPRPGLRGGPRRQTGRRQPLPRPPLRAARGRRHPRLPPRRHAGQPGAGRRRLAAGGVAAAAGGAVGAGALLVRPTGLLGARAGSYAWRSRMSRMSRMNRRSRRKLVIMRAAPP